MLHFNRPGFILSPFPPLFVEMKALGFLLFIFLSLFNLGQASRLAAPAEMLAMYNAYALDFFKNGATRTLAPKLGNEALADFGTFVSHVWVWKDTKPPQNGLFLSQSPEYSKATLSQITRYLPKRPLYDVENLLGVKPPKPIIHKDVLDKLTDIVKSTRDSNAPGFSDKWKVHLPEFKRALAGINGARMSEMFSVGLKPLFERDHRGKTLQSSPFPVLDTDVSYDRANWGLTLTANNGRLETVGEWKTWYVGLRNSRKDLDVMKYINHQKISTSIARSLTELDSMDSCD